jgi:hypothetical protein
LAAVLFPPPEPFVSSYVYRFAVYQSHGETARKRTSVNEKNDPKRPKSKTNARTRAEEPSQAKRPRDQQGLSPSLQDHIGRQLRAMFDDVAQEPVPDRFLQLLKDLEQSGDK